MDKKRKIQLTIIIIIMIMLIVFATYVIGKSVYDYVEKTKMSNETVELFNKTYEKEGQKVILIASKNCKWCQKFVPVLDEISKEYNIKYTYINAGLLFEDDLAKIYEKMNIKFTGIPHLIILKDKKVVGSQVGAETKENTIELFKKVGLIEGDVEDEQSVSASS
jgi:predicted bacteriocin transport accessory protein